MLSSSFRSAARRLQLATTLLLKIAAFGLFASLALQASAAGDRPIKSRVAPVYPDLAKHLRIGGIVVVEAVVDPAGKVIEVKAISGSKVLSYAAEEAVRKWTFAPAPEKSTESVDIKFALAE
jgi:TonB family protein